MVLSTTALLSFALAHLLAAATPGPNLFLISNLSMAISRKHGLMSALGVTTSVFVWSALAALGLNTFLETFPLLHDLLKYIGSAYLIWLGFKYIRSAKRSCKVTEATVGEIEETTVFSAYRRGFMVNMTNPKTIAYYTSVYAVIVPSDAPLAGLLEVVATAVFVSGLWWSCVALTFSIQRVSTALSNLWGYLELVAGMAFIGFGIRNVLD